MNIVYMGTPRFAVPPLAALKEAGHNILCAVSQPDKPVGRHSGLKPTAVKEAAFSLGTEVLQPQKASDPAFIEAIRRMEPDVIVVCAYGKLLRKELLDIPKKGCINIHGSLLPRWRGAAPIQWAVIAGDERSGLTTMLMNEGLDTGDILLKEEVALDEDETGGSLFDKLSKLGGPLVVKTLKKLEDGSLRPMRQDEELATYAPILKKEMGRLDFTKDAAELERLVRGLYPWPGAFTHAGGKLLKIHSALSWENGEEEERHDECGRFIVSGSDIFVTCGRGSVLQLTEVQLEGKKRMSSADFLLGSRKLLEV